MKPVYIFDLDGTLALIEHRRHLVERPDCKECDGTGGEVEHLIEETIKRDCDHCKGTGKDKSFKPNWAKFFTSCTGDAPNIAVIDTYRRLAASGAEIWIWSGRSEDVRPQTETWLARYVGTQYAQLLMRPTGDYTHDDVMKLHWLGTLTPQDRMRVVAVFDDRDKVVNMWRQNGVPCFQVAPGQF